MKRTKGKKKPMKFENLSLLQYVLLELGIGLLDLAIFIVVIKSGVI
jgi:hypothetical protein